VDSDPDTLVAVRRKDVDLDTKEGREMAMLDNLTTQVNLAWDETEIESISDQVEGFDVGDFGFELTVQPNIDVDTLKDNVFINGFKEDKGVFQMSFVFPMEHKEMMNAIVLKYGKEYLEQKIIELCRSVEVK
jgi:hypothetical protein